MQTTNVCTSLFTLFFSFCKPLEEAKTKTKPSKWCTDKNCTEVVNCNLDSGECTAHKIQKDKEDTTRIPPIKMCFMTWSQFI